MAPAYKDIFEAAECDDEEAVRYYIEEKGVLPNTTNNHEMTVAHIAARKGNLNIVKYVLEKDRPIRNFYQVEEAVIRLAIKYGNLDIVKYFVEKQNFCIEHRYTNHIYGNTAIHFAAQYEQQEVLNYFLVERDGNVNVENNVMQTPLFDAVENRCHPMIKYLIENQLADVNHVDYMYETILDKAIKKEDFVMLKYFIHERKMKVEEKWRNEQIHLAASFDGLSLMEFLVNELHTNVNAADPLGKTPLHKAAGDNNYAMCEYLLDHGANPNLRDVRGLAAADETKNENITALLAGASSAPRNRRSVFEPVHLTNSSTREVERLHQRLSSKVADHTQETRENICHTFQNFLFMVRIGFGRSVDSVRPPLRFEETYDRHFAHLAMEAALHHHQRFGGA